MKTSKAYDKIKAKFSGIISDWDVKNPARLFFEIPPESIKDVVGFVFNELGLRFIIATGTDTRKAVELLYHFADDSSGAIISVRVTLSDKMNLKINSISDIFIGASWIEREIHELLGVDFPGNDNLKHLLLKDDWPKDDFPLRHDNDR